jgi:hypothetical protein
MYIEFFCQALIEPHDRGDLLRIECHISSLSSKSVNRLPVAMHGVADMKISMTPVFAFFVVLRYPE